MKYNAIVSSDWNECLAPTGPFDPLSFVFPELARQMDIVFRSYTSNEISLAQATQRIGDLLPSPISEEQMDSYLDSSFAVYRGVPELIEWCLRRNILFMINTTGMQGFFQRVLAKGFIPPVPAVAANPLIRFAGADDDPRFAYPVQEIEDKPRHTESVMRTHGIAPSRVIVIGDSGGDGPHFQWASSKGAIVVGSMTKASLARYCEQRGITISKHFGLSAVPGQAADREREMEVDFRELADFIEDVL